MERLTFTQEIGKLGTDIVRYFRVIGALLKREERARRADPAESILELLEPILLIGALSFAWWFLDRRNSSPLGGSPVLFYGTGFFIMYFFVYISNKMKRAIDAPVRRYPVEERLDHILVHLILRVVDYSILGLIVFTTIYVFFTVQALPWKPSAVAQAIVAIVMLGFGWGIFNLVLAKIWRFWAFIFPPLNRVLMIFTGVLYIVDFMAPTARWVMSYIPLVHAVSLFRLGFYPNQPTLILDTNYMWLCAIAFVAIGLALERVTRRSE